MSTKIFEEIDAIVAQRVESFQRERDQLSSSGSYTMVLLADKNLRLKKIGEEATEFVIACVEEDVDAMTCEAADLIYHTLVALRSAGIELDAVAEELQRRRSSQ